MGQDRKGLISTPGTQGKRTANGGGILPGQARGHAGAGLSGRDISWLRTVASQQAARMSNGLLHVHTLCCKRLIKGHRAASCRPADAAAGVDHASHKSALGQVLGTSSALLPCACGQKRAGDEEEAVLILGADLRWPPRCGCCLDDQTDGGAVAV